METDGSFLGEVLDDINSFKDSLLTLMCSAKMYSKTFKDYAVYKYRDAELLKEKLIKKVNESLNDNID